MHPSDWLVMADCVRDGAAHSDAIVMLHGTDTMAWTASALSYLLNDVSVPVVLTGSMLPAEAPGSDASGNIYAAFHFALQLAMYKRRGVSVAFAGLLLHGPRITKIDSRRKNAFVGVDYPFLGEMRGPGDPQDCLAHGPGPGPIDRAALGAVPGGRDERRPRPDLYGGAYSYHDHHPR